MKNKIFFIVFMIVWITLIIANFIIPKSNFLEKENRYAASFPEFNFKDLVNGEYSEKLNDYINDHFIIRNFWIKLNSFVQVSTGKTENNGVYIGKDGYLFEKYKYGEEEKANLVKISNAVNEFSENLNIPIYFMLVPNSIYINKEKLPDNVETYDQNEIINSFYNKINKDITTINVVDTLTKAKDTQLYFRTDHHMTSYGAYLIYSEFCKAANLKTAKLSEFEKEVVSREFLGTLDSKAQLLNQKKDDIIVFKNDINQNVKGTYDGVKYESMFNEEYLNKRDKYSYFLNGNSANAVIKTKLNNGKKLLIIKDSYAHIMAQFIAQNYEEVHFIDPRYYNVSISKYAKENGITDVLFLYNVSNMLTDINLRGIK